MKKALNIFTLLLISSSFIFQSCNDLFSGNRTSHSDTISSVNLEDTTLTFGDSVLSKSLAEQQSVDVQQSVDEQQSLDQQQGIAEQQNESWRDTISKLRDGSELEQEDSLRNIQLQENYKTVMKKESKKANRIFEGSK